MTTNVAEAVQDALARLDGAGSEIVLDFSTVDRVDPNALRALQNLAGKAHDRSVRVVLGGVNIDVYKVLKLIKIERQFRFQ